MKPVFTFDKPWRAVCVDNTDYTADLTEGKTYTITQGFVGYTGVFVYYITDEGEEDWTSVLRFAIPLVEDSTETARSAGEMVAKAPKVA